MAASEFPLRISGAHRWSNCHGSPIMETRYPGEDGPEAREGTAGHWVATELVQGRAAKLGDVAPNGVVVTLEMLEGAALYMAAVYERIPYANMVVEQTLPAPEISPDVGGTPDTYGFGYEPWTMELLDYKFGHGFVEVFENDQLVGYASAIISALVAQDVDREVIEANLRFRMTIVQPRNYHRDGPVRSWIVAACDLRAHFNRLRYAAEMYRRPDVTTKVGAWCEHCTARVGCPALQQAGYLIADYVGGPTPFDLTPDQTGRELAWLDQASEALEARRDALQVAALKFLQAGKGVPNYEIVHEVCAEKWIEGKEEEAIQVCALLNKDIRKPVVAITPTQARKLAVDDSVIKLYSHRPTGKAKLAPLDTTKTRKIFGGNTA